MVFPTSLSYLLTLEYADELGHSNHMDLKIFLKSKGKKFKSNSAIKYLITNVKYT